MINEVKKDDPTDSTETPGDVRRPVSDNSKTSRQKALAEEIMQDDSKVLKRLAK